MARQSHGRHIIILALILLLCAVYHVKARLVYLPVDESRNFFDDAHNAGQRTAEFNARAAGDYTGPVMAVPQRDGFVGFRDPETGNAFAAINSPIGFEVHAVTNDPKSRTFYALMRNTTANSPGLAVCQFDMSSTGAWPCFIMGTEPDGLFTKGGIAYTPSIGVIVTRQDMLPDWFVNFSRGSRIAGNLTANGALDIVAYDNAAGLKYISYIDATNQAATILDYSASLSLTGDFMGDATAVTFQPLLNALIFGGKYALLYTPFNDSARGFPLAIIGKPARIACYVRAQTPLDMLLWVALSEEGLIRIYNYSTSTDSGYFSVYVPVNTTAITYMPGIDIDLQPADNTSDIFSETASPTYGSTPTFSLQGKGANDITSEQTSIQFGPFESDVGNISFPDTWLKDQQLLEAGDAYGGIIIKNANSSASSYSYVWSASLKNRTIISLTSLYNPSSELTLSAPGNLQYSLIPGVVKYSLALYTENGQLFNTSQYGSLVWSTCYSNDETLGVFDLNYTVQLNEQTQVKSYIFKRLNNARTYLRLNVPLQAVLDNIHVATVAHNVSAAHIIQQSNGSETLEVCIRWQFPFFNTSLFYDPDIGVLVDGAAPSDSDGDNEKLALEVAIPIVFGVVLILSISIIVIGVVVGYVTLRHRRRKRQQYLNALS